MRVLALALLAAATPARAAVNAIWANEGGDKVLREELRATADPARVVNRAWNGSEIRLFGARNEVISFNLVLEALAGARGVSVRFDRLAGPGGAVIESRPAAPGEALFDWTQRPIELFYVRYLKIEGLSSVSYSSNYDERHVPSALRRPWTGNGQGSGKWTDRPGADKHFPEIAAPLELHPRFDIAPAQSQSVWADIYVSRFAAPGEYAGEVVVEEEGQPARRVPVRLQVRRFKLPEVPASKTMIALGHQDVNMRYAGRTTIKPGTANEQLIKLVRDRHYLLAHRHKLSLVDSDPGATAWGEDRPRPEWIPRLDGSLFSPLNGYEGPGVFTGNNIYSIGTYGTWGWRREDDERAMWRHTDRWEGWFSRHFPGVERFLYLIDESRDHEQTERWAGWMKANPGPGRALPSYTTLALPEAVRDVPSLDIASSTFAVADTAKWQAAADRILAQPGKAIHLYNGKRPASGSFATEDDGTALRELPWGQYKKKVARWFFWESTYYADYQAGGSFTNVFRTAQTIGTFSRTDEVYGKTGYLYANGDGVLFYPGTDKVFADESYGIPGPIASLRLKHWRRGVQDVDYLQLAAAIDPARTQAIVERMVPRVLWEVGIADPADPTWNKVDISWSSNPDDWEAARAELADIIESRL
jgi:hypothetical protein